MVRELAEVLSTIERRGRAQGLLGEWLMPLVERGFDAIHEIRERENRATRLIDEANETNRED